jgi:hypothetical protein
MKKVYFKTLKLLCLPTFLASSASLIAITSCVNQPSGDIVLTSDKQTLSFGKAPTADISSYIEHKSNIFPELSASGDQNAN